MVDDAPRTPQETGDDHLDQAVRRLLERNPGRARELDARARARLAQVLADPAGQSWMEAAGLMDSDSCGYPVTGGLADVRSDLAALPAARDEAVRRQVLDRLTREWADDYVLTGRARLDRPWTTYVPDRD